MVIRPVNVVKYCKHPLGGLKQHIDLYLPVQRLLLLLLLALMMVSLIVDDPNAKHFRLVVDALKLFS